MKINSVYHRLALYISPPVQVVGCTIDAGAKIYAGRVDAVHGDILKMLGSMGNTEAEGENETGKSFLMISQF